MHIRCEKSLEEAFQQAVKHGVIIVAAAGNQGTLGSTVITRHQWVIPVVACNLVGRPTNESNLGSSIGRHGLCALGEDIISLGAEGKPLTFGGTSVAVPFVTGAIELLWSAFPKATATQIKFSILQGAASQRASVVPPLLNVEAAYNDCVPFMLNGKFPERVSYNRFIELAQSVLVPLCACLSTRRVASRGISFVDSTPLRVCRNKRIPRHKVFRGIARRGKSSMGWFYGFKLHLIIDDEGNLVSFFASPGNLDDRKGLKEMIKFVKGELFGDKGCISRTLREELWESGIQLITNARRNMKKVILEGMDN